MLGYLGFEGAYTPLREFLNPLLPAAVSRGHISSVQVGEFSVDGLHDFFLGYFVHARVVVKLQNHVSHILAANLSCGIGFVLDSLFHICVPELHPKDHDGAKGSFEEEFELVSDVFEAEPGSGCSPGVTTVGGSDVVGVGSEPHGKGLCFNFSGSTVMYGLERRETLHLKLRGPFKYYRGMRVKSLFPPSYRTELTDLYAGHLDSCNAH